MAVFDQSCLCAFSPAHSCSLALFSLSLSFSTPPMSIRRQLLHSRFFIEILLERKPATRRSQFLNIKAFVSLLREPLSIRPFCSRVFIFIQRKKTGKSYIGSFSPVKRRNRRKDCAPPKASFDGRSVLLRLPGFFSVRRKIATSIRASETHLIKVYIFPACVCAKATNSHHREKWSATPARRLRDPGHPRKNRDPSPPYFSVVFLPPLPQDPDRTGGLFTTKLLASFEKAVKFLSPAHSYSSRYARTDRRELNSPNLRRGCPRTAPPRLLERDNSTGQLENNRRIDLG